ncbi:MAG TPA: hypothetical protein VEQ87_11480 [Burkholderiales bacterium]|nr:hypothetical protein [Burkholderiales bacterium]
MPSFRAPDERRLARRFLDAVATAWAIAALAAIGIVAAGLALIVLPVAFLAVWCLDALYSIKPIEID